MSLIEIENINLSQPDTILSSGFNELSNPMTAPEISPEIQIAATPSELYNGGKGPQAPYVSPSGNFVRPG